MTNNGPDTASDVTLTDFPPANATLVGFATSQGKVDLNSPATGLVAALGTIASKSSATLTLTVRAEGLGTLVNTASVYADQANLVPATASTSITSTVINPPIEGDFDGDGTSDPAVYGKDPVTGKYRFRVLTSLNKFDPTKPLVFDNNGYGFGNAKSIPVPAAYFGDGRADFALWTPNNVGGMTFTVISPVNGKSVTVNFGTTTDLPVIADVDGDGKADFGVYGYVKGQGYRFDFLLSSANFDPTKQDFFNNNGYGFGNAKSIPIVGDFDGSGHAGFGLFNPSASGSVFTYISPSGKSFTKSFGTQNDLAMAVDYDGDGRPDLAVYGKDPATGRYRYAVLTSSSGYDPSKAVVFDNYGYGYGNSTSILASSDYEGTGKADFALYTKDFTSKNGNEYVYQASQTGAGVVVDFAALTDIPIEAPAYVRARFVRGLPVTNGPDRLICGGGSAP